jgi:hypothetical protein
MFPVSAAAARYNKRLRALAATMAWLIEVLARDTRQAREFGLTPVDAAAAAVNCRGASL